MARPSSLLPKWCKLVRSNPAAYERDVFSKPGITSPADAAALLRPSLQREEVEVFVVIAMDAQHRPLGLVRVTSGVVNQTLVMAREVFRIAILLNASAIIVAHNHPSGDPTPSDADRRVTDVLVNAGSMLDIPVFDHIIIGAGDRFTSFATQGLL
jgi:DNA repair protein RadC